MPLSLFPLIHNSNTRCSLPTNLYTSSLNPHVTSNSPILATFEIHFRSHEYYNHHVFRTLSSCLQNILDLGITSYLNTTSPYMARPKGARRANVRLVFSPESDIGELFITGVYVHNMINTILLYNPQLANDH